MSKHYNIAQSIAIDIEDVIKEFLEQMPDLQDKINAKVNLILKNLEIKDDAIVPSTKNLKEIEKLKSEIENVVFNTKYIEAATKFAKSFDSISQSYLKYYREFNSNYDETELQKLFRKKSIAQTVQSLTGAGINANIIDEISKIITDSVFNGAKYSDVLKKLNEHITQTKAGAGSLERYTKQMATDGLNQFAANYSQNIAENLDFEWFQYVGSNRSTTRPFCEHLTKKRYFHKDELKTILHGKIDGHQVPISDKTKLPYGMVPGTNESNFITYRGGYNCNHQVVGVSDVLVGEKAKNVREFHALDEKEYIKTTAQADSFKNERH